MEYTVPERMHCIFIVFHSAGVLAMLCIARVATWVPPGKLLVNLLLLSVGGCLLAGVSAWLVISPGWYASSLKGHLPFTFMAYCGFALLIPSFSVVMSFIASLVPLTGKRSGLLSFGGALGPLIAGGGAELNVTVLLLLYTGLLLIAARAVVLMDRMGKQQDE